MKEKLQLYFKKRQNRVSISGISVKIDWIIILVIASVITLIGLFFAIITYFDITSGTVFDIDSGQDALIETEQKKKEIQQTVESLRQD